MPTWQIHDVLARRGNTSCIGLRSKYIMYCGLPQMQLVNQAAMSVAYIKMLLQVLYS